MYRDSNLLYQSLEESAAGHNGAWKFIDLTDSYNNGDFSKWVASGKFTNIFPGCYVVKTKTIDGVTYTDHIDMIIDCDPYYGKWNGTAQIKTHHVGLVPWTSIGESCMNQSSTTVGGFHGSYMYTKTLPKYLTGYKSAYGDSHFLLFGNNVSTAISSTAVGPGCTAWTGVANDWKWYATYITLLSEVQVYGSRVWGGAYDVGEGNSQLAAFRLNQSVRNFNSAHFWLRAIAGSTTFALAASSGDAATRDASLTACVRPLLLLY